MAIKKTAKRKSSGKGFSVEDTMKHAVIMATNRPLLFNQAKAFVFFVFSLLVLTGGSFLLGGVLFLAAWSTQQFVLMFLAIFVAVLLWFVGINIATVFFNGIRFHLAMQHATHKPLDFHLAWKLSAARWHDAFWTQIVLDGLIFGLLALAALIVILVAQWNIFAGIMATALGIVGLVLLVLYIQPYLFLLFPVAYFESLSPRNIFKRAVEYVKPHFWNVFFIVILFGISAGVISGGISSFTSTMLATISNQHPVLALGEVLIVIALTLLVEIFLSTLGTCIQTQLYLRIGSPNQQNVFVSRDPLAKHLSRMAKHAPHHSPYFPVKWKSPGKKKK